jgi:hypothetical protein
MLERLKALFADIEPVTDDTGALLRPMTHGYRLPPFWFT